MKEFMLLIKKQKTDEDIVSEEFLKACENYIKALKHDGRLISAQPIEEKNNMILSKDKSWKIVPVKDTKEVVGGYYHLLAKDLDDAIAIAKANPEFEYHPQSRIEIRPIKTMEDSSGFIYPTNAMDVVESLSYIDEIEIPF